MINVNVKLLKHMKGFHKYKKIFFYFLFRYLPLITDHLVWSSKKQDHLFIGDVYQ